MSPETMKRKSSRRLKVDYDYMVVKQLREVPVKGVRIAVAGQYGNRHLGEEKLEVAVVPLPECDCW